MIKNNLYIIRAKKGIRFVKEMAEFLQIDRTTYARYEKGEMLPSVEQALLIAEKLNMKVEDIWYIDR